MTGQPAPDALVVRVTRTFDAPAARVFDAWLDPQRARKFLFATPAGRMTRVEIDARVHGRFAIVEQRGDQGAGHFGRYTEIDRPCRLAFTFTVDEQDETGDLVTIDIVPKGTGCELTLTHRMKPEWAEYLKQTEQGWAGIVDGLATTLN